MVMDRISSIAMIGRLPQLHGYAKNNTHNVV